jgi:hypothetical protein
LYILVLSMSSFICLIIGVAMILKTSTIKEAVSREWYEIQERLKASGYDIGESTFSNFLEVNLKFGGLFVIVFCLFLILGLIPAIYLSIVLKKKGAINLGGIGVFSTPFRLNSEIQSPKLRNQLSPNDSEI